MSNQRRNLFIIALIISLFLHSVTALRVWFTSMNERKDESIEVTIVDQKMDPKLLNTAKQIVEQSEQRLNDEIDEKAKYLSRFNQKVIEQTKAADHGRFQNEAKDGPAAKNKMNNDTAKQVTQPKEKTQQQAKKSKSETSDDGLPTLAALKPQFQWEKVQVGVQNPGPRSQTDDHLKEVKTGPQTLLSSREFVYYTYYSRIKERLRMFWEPKIKEKVSRIFAAGRSIATSEERITKLVITLDKSGKLLKVQVLGASGLQDLDDAAVEAFQAAAPFPNPPHGIVDGDGTIKIRWDFILEA